MPPSKDKFNHGLAPHPLCPSAGAVGRFRCFSFAQYCLLDGFIYLCSQELGNDLRDLFSVGPGREGSADLAPQNDKVRVLI